MRGRWNSSNRSSGYRNQMRKVTRTKVLVVPYTESRVLMVKDRRTGEWGFVSGGAKQRDINDSEKSDYRCGPIFAAFREMKEETSGTFQIIPDCKGIDYFTFDTQYRPPSQLESDKKQNIKVNTVYHVYMYHLPENTPVKPKNFVPNNEVTELIVEDYDKIPMKWDFIDYAYKNFGIEERLIKLQGKN